MITVKIDEADLLDMLVDRVDYWTSDRDVLKLYEQYYDSLVYGGCFEDAELDINSIVDNDYVNYLTVVDRDEYNKDREEFLKDSIRNFIEENKDLYDEEEKADFLQELKDKIEELKEEAPEFDDLEVGDGRLFNGRYDCIEAKTDDLILIRY